MRRVPLGSESAPLCAPAMLAFAATNLRARAAEDMGEVNC